MYDAENHWEECTICNEKRNKIVHTFTITWALGKESCLRTNSYTKTCSCGYSETGHKPCVWNGTKYIAGAAASHARVCSICNAQIIYLYYLNSYGNGKIYNANYESEYSNKIDKTAKDCYNSSGKKLDCNNLGTCAKCKRVYSKPEHSLYINKQNKIVCCICNGEYGTIKQTITKDKNAPTTYTITDNIILTNGATFKSTYGIRDIGNIWQTKNQTISNKNSNNTEFTVTTTAKFRETVKVPYEAYAYINVSIAGVSYILRTCLAEEMWLLYPDTIEPVISSISNGESSIDEWSKSKPIIISGTENWTNTVKVKIVDDKQNIVFSGETIVTNGKYSISCTPELEAGLEGRTFKVIVTDTCENSTEQEFTISKIDSIPPEATSNTEVRGDWAKEKSFTAVASDHGIGNVQIAFNDVADYELATKNGNEYTREYKLIGDVYSPTKARIFYKDELNNIGTQEITIDKLDNTAPTITDSRFDNNKLLLESNDIKEGLGEGSGVTKYRFITSESKLENPEVTKENSVEVLINENIIIPDMVTAKYVYVVAEDLVRKYEQCL